MPLALTSMNLHQREQQINEILELNDTTNKFGLLLNATEITQILEERNKDLKYIGRIDFSIEVTKNLVANFCNSSFITQETYVETLQGLHTVFYHLKNETMDKIGDTILINLIKDYFENSCGGSVEVLKGKLNEFFQIFHSIKKYLSVKIIL